MLQICLNGVIAERLKIQSTATRIRRRSRCAAPQFSSLVVPPKPLPEKKPTSLTHSKMAACGPPPPLTPRLSIEDADPLILCVSASPREFTVTIPAVCTLLDVRFHPSLCRSGGRLGESHGENISFLLIKLYLSEFLAPRCCRPCYGWLRRAHVYSPELDPAGVVPATVSR